MLETPLDRPDLLSVRFTHSADGSGIGYEGLLGACPTGHGLSKAFQEQTDKLMSLITLHSFLRDFVTGICWVTSRDSASRLHLVLLFFGMIKKFIHLHPSTGNHDQISGP